MSKYFIINEERESLSKEDIEAIEINNQYSQNKVLSDRDEKANKAIQNDLPLKAPVGRIIIKTDIEYKNQVAFNDTTIRLERQFNNLNRRETEPVNAWVIDAEGIPQGAEVIIHHNAINDTNRIFDCEDLIEGEQSNDVRYYSIKDNECFLWRIGTDEWQPCTIFETALRVFKPYDGVLENIESTKIKDTLFVTSGILKNNVVSTIKASDFELIFNDEKGREQRVIRFRPFGDEENDREPEAIAILHDLTKQVNESRLLIGLNPSDCKSLKEYYEK